MNHEERAHLSEWQRHTVTQGIAGDLLEEQAKVLVRVLSAARATQDVSIRSLMAQYDTLNRMVVTMTKEPKPEEPDAEPDEDDSED